MQSLKNIYAPKYIAHKQKYRTRIGVFYTSIGMLARKNHTLGEAASSFRGRTLGSPAPYPGGLQSRALPGCEGIWCRATDFRNAPTSFVHLHKLFSDRAREMSRERSPGPWKLEQMHALPMRF